METIEIVTPDPEVAVEKKSCILSAIRNHWKKGVAAVVVIAAAAGIFLYVTQEEGSGDSGNGDTV